MGSEKERETGLVTDLGMETEQGQAQGSERGSETARATG